MTITKNFSVEEFMFSNTATRFGIDNTPPIAAMECYIDLCDHFLEPLRAIIQVPITITSGYRSPELNSKIGGSRESQHMRGEAADFRAKGFTPLQLCEIAAENELPFDQLIHEFRSWVHVSYTSDGNRFQKLTARKDGKKTIYLPGNVW